MNVITLPIEKANLAEDSSSCIYTLYNDGVAIYAGQTINLAQRLIGHKGYKDFDSFSFFNVSVEDLNNAEAKEIARVNPTQNKNMPQNDLFVQSKPFIKSVSDVITKKLKDNASFIGCARTHDAEGLIYTDVKYTEALTEHIKNFEFKVEIK